MKANIPVVELRRVSTADQGNFDRAGLEKQIAANSCTIKFFNLEVREIVTIATIKDAEISSTAEIKKILNLIKCGEVRGIVLTDLNYLFNQSDFNSFGVLHQIKEANALLYVNNELINVSDPNGFLRIGLLSLSQQQLIQFREKVFGVEQLFAPVEI